MSDDDSSRIDALLDAALDLAPGAREAFLHAQCGDNLSLCERLLSLLRDARPTDDFLERPLIVQRRISEHEEWFEPGELVAGRFRVKRLLGRGGMGEVYEADDAELREVVALKTIRAEIAGDPRVIERFRQEVSRARSVAHPNVCRVFEFFSHERPSGVVRFLTMEFLPGETLMARLVRGPLTPDAALPILRQIAAALDAAHQKQIVHRDLKPSNVMLVGDTTRQRAVVTDFGLATDVSGDEGRRQLVSDPHAGTEHYIAPEQRTSAIVSPAADIYAFGVLMHALVAGHPTRETHSSDREAGGTVVDEGIPLVWRRASEACRQIEPSARPATATAAIDLIERAVGWRRRLRSALLAAIVMAPIALGLRFVWQEPPPTGGTLVMASITNTTGEPDVEATTDLLRFQLRQSTYLSLVEPEQVADTLHRMVRAPATGLTLEDAREVAWRRGADGLVAGTLRSTRPGYLLTVRVEARGARADTPGRTWSRGFEARDRRELQGVIASAARWIRSVAGEAASDIPRTDRSLEETTTRSWEAAALYSRAEVSLTQGQTEDGLALLEEAVRLDPEFAMAWMRLGDVLMSRRQLDEAYSRWNKALSVFAQRRLTPREDFRIRGMFASDTHDFAEAARVHRLYALAYPKDFAAHFYAGRPLLMLGRIDDAILALEQALRIDPQSMRAWAQLAMLNLRAGRLDAAAEQIAALRRLGHSAWAVCLDAQLQFLRGNHQAALEGFERLQDSNEPLLQSRSAALQAAVWSDIGRDRHALAVLRRGVERDADTGQVAARVDKLMSIAELLLREGRTTECRDVCILIQQLDQSPLRLARLAAVLARAGYPRDAERLVARVPSQSSSRRLRIDRDVARAEILLSRNAVHEAWDLFQQTARQEAAGVWTEYLARAAWRAGELGTATVLYERMAKDPGYFWRYPDDTPPGLWRQALLNAAKLSEARKPDSGAVRRPTLHH